MKRWLYYTLLLIALLASLVFGVPPAAQPAEVHAAPDTVTIRPNGAGDEAVCTIGGSTPAATNWESVDDVTSDVDTTYVFDLGAGYSFDLYNLADTALSGSINSVTVYVNVRGAEKAGSIGAQTRIKTNGVAYVGAEIAVTTSYVANSTVYNTNPQTTAAWTWLEVNALQAGVGLQKPTGGAETRCTQVWVVVDYTPVLPPDISNTPTSHGFGVLAEGATAATAINNFTVTNNSGYAVNITISGTDLTGGTTWTLSDTATPGTDTYGLKAGLDDADDLFDIIVKPSSPDFLVEGLADSASQSWGLQILAPDIFTGGGENSGTVTLTATAA